MDMARAKGKQQPGHAKTYPRARWRIYTSLLVCDAVHRRHTQLVFLVGQQKKVSVEKQEHLKHCLQHSALLLGVVQKLKKQEGTYAVVPAEVWLCEARG